MTKPSGWTRPCGQVDRVEDRLQQVRDGRFGDRAERQRADGDAELGGGHHLRQVLQALQDLPGPRGALGRERFDLAAAHGDQGELGADEEAVGEHEQQPAKSSWSDAHRAASATLAAARRGGAVAYEPDPLGAVVADLRAPRAASRRSSAVSPGGRDPAEQVGDQSGDRLVRALGHVQADAGAGCRRGSCRRRPRRGGRPRAGRRRGRAGRAPSCSSRTSPTSSSTMSSRVTTPAVPPYSSTTTAIGCSLRSRSSSGCTGSVSGTSSGGAAIRPTGVRSRSCGGHGEGVLEVDHADDLVEAVAVDGEAGQAGGAGEVDHVLGGGAAPAGR